MTRLLEGETEDYTLEAFAVSEQISKLMTKMLRKTPDYCLCEFEVVAYDAVSRVVSNTRMQRHINTKAPAQ